MSLRQVIHTYAAYSKNEEVRKNSSSGGIFSLLAELAFEKKGVVYGIAATDDCKKLVYHRVDNASDLAKLRSSKYFQAKVGDTFRKVESDLEEGRFVLFTGTGCQINGLKTYLQKEYENLYCVDVLCHGVPSEALWVKYINHLENKVNGHIVYVNFRCKDKSWKEFGLKGLSDNNAVIFNHKSSDPFMKMFLKNYCLRPSCYECHAKIIKKSDITIGDFWGIEDVCSELDDGKGTSLVITRTDRGQLFFDELAHKMVCKEVCYEQAIRKNPVEFESVKRPIQRDTFFDDMNSMSFDELANKYLNSPNASLIRRSLSRIKRIVKKLSGGTAPVS